MEQQTRKLIEAQIDKSEKKLKAAKELITAGFADDAISRAYYAVFHATSAVLLAEGLTVESHSALKNAFGLHLVKSGKIDKQYARILSRLKDERENGDYDIFTSFDTDDACDDFAEAEKFIAEIKRYLSIHHDIKF